VAPGWLDRPVVLYIFCSANTDCTTLYVVPVQTKERPLKVLPDSCRPNSNASSKFASSTSRCAFRYFAGDADSIEPEKLEAALLLLSSDVFQKTS